MEVRVPDAVRTRPRFKHPCQCCPYLETETARGEDDEYDMKEIGTTSAKLQMAYHTRETLT